MSLSSWFHHPPAPPLLPPAGAATVSIVPTGQRCAPFDQTQASALKSRKEATKGALLQSALTRPPCVAQSSAFHRLAYTRIGWLLGNATPRASWFLKSLIGVPSTANLHAPPTHDGVGVEGLGGVEPEAELLLALPLPLREHVGVQRVRLAGHVPQELEVDLIVGRTLRRQVEGGDGAGGVAGDELDLHVDLAEEVLALGLEPRAGAPVKREVEPTATID
ncbi:Os06g0696450, partial [Oryza sativa Japonica Group]